MNHMTQAKGTHLQKCFLLIICCALFPQRILRGQTPPQSIPIIQAINQGNLTEARNILHSGAKLNVFDNFGQTPLITAISRGYHDFAEELLSAGADPSYTSPNQTTALMAAAWQRDLELARRLLDLHVPVNAEDSKGLTALMLAPYKGSDGKMVKLLLDAGADPKIRALDGFTALISAARSGDAVAADELLKAGADPTAKDKYGNTAESVSCERGEVGHYRVCILVRDALKGSSGK